MDYTDYDDYTLKKLQELELMMLKDFIKICDENNLEYFMYSGSLIGAVRHKGFIPWDDDIDVIMFREDYDKFVEIFKSQKNEKYDLLTAENTDDYFLLFSKIVLKGTKFEEWWFDQVNFDLGIFIDIFVLDDAPKNKFSQKIFTRRAHILNRFISISTLKFSNYPKSTQFIVNTLHLLFKKFNLSPCFFKKKFFNLIKKNNGSDSVFIVSSWYYNEIYQKTDWTPSVKLQFEDIMVNVPNDYDKILTRLYGDYMQLPPEEDRYNHITETLDFGPYSP